MALAALPGIALSVGGAIGGAALGTTLAGGLGAGILGTALGSSLGGAAGGAAGNALGSAIVGKSPSALGIGLGALGGAAAPVLGGALGSGPFASVFGTGGQGMAQGATSALQAPGALSVPQQAAPSLGVPQFAQTAGLNPATSGSAAVTAQALSPENQQFLQIIQALKPEQPSLMKQLAVSGAGGAISTLGNVLTRPSPRDDRFSGDAAAQLAAASGSLAEILRRRRSQRRYV